MKLLRLQSGQPCYVPIFLIVGFISIACLRICLAGDFTLTQELLNRIEQEHGSFARQRVVFWNRLMTGYRDADTLEKLRVVNDFFNQLNFVNDTEHWGTEDYWATPLQMLTSNGGDCEDFSIAKYFTLREMGIPAEHMRLTYVKALNLNQAHMVLTYYQKPDADPLVLDNLVTDIRPSSARKDLLPVYSFNGNSLWLAKKRGAEQRVGKAARLSRWQEVIARINDEQISLPR